MPQPGRHVRCWDHDREGLPSPVQQRQGLKAPILERRSEMTVMKEGMSRLKQVSKQRTGLVKRATVENVVRVQLMAMTFFELNRAFVV